MNTQININKMNAFFKLPAPYNEPVKAYAPNSPERKALKAALAKMSSEQKEVPMPLYSSLWVTVKFLICLPWSLPLKFEMQESVGNAFLDLS